MYGITHELWKKNVNIVSTLAYGGECYNTRTYEPYKACLYREENGFPCLSQNLYCAQRTVSDCLLVEVV